jgi:hypothetical protein
MVPTFLSAVWHGEAFHRMLQSQILVDALFLLDGGRKREKQREREIAMGEEGFSGTGPTLLTESQVASVRCN